MRRLILCLLVVAAATLANTGQAFAATLIVDDDGRASPPANCGAPTPTFTMIEPAVEASNPGDTVNVCPGTYPEQVSVEADESAITLRSIVFRAAVIKAPPVMTEPGDVVTINAAQNATLRDFTIAGPLPDHLFCSLALRTGVRVIGGGSAIVRGNRITEMRAANPALRGCQNGFGLAVGRQFEGQTGRVTGFDNHIDLYQKGGVYVDNAGSRAELWGNLVQGEGPTPVIAQNGVQISRGAVANARGNRVEDNTYSLAPVFSASGILLFQAGATTTISSNRVVRNDDNIAAYGGTSGTTILRNVVLDSTFFDGIYMGVDTANNRIEENFLRNNAEHDCHDDSVGPNNEPALVANFWIDNDGLTENREGLCEPQEREECPDDDEDNDGLTDESELLLLTLLGSQDSDLDGIKDGNDDANGNGEDDEDEDDDDDDCPNDSDGDGEDDEDEDDDD
jgi:hypothetical protein